MDIHFKLTTAELLGSLAAIIALYAVVMPAELKKAITSLFQKSEQKTGEVLANFSKKDISFSWQLQISRLLDNAFGYSLFSKKAFFRTALHSYLICQLILLPISIRLLINSPANPESAISYSSLLLMTVIFPLSIFSATLLPDFLAICISRKLIRTYIDKNSFVWIAVLLLILLSNILLGLLSVVLMELKIIWGEFAWSNLIEVEFWKEHILDIMNVSKDWNAKRNSQMAYTQYLFSFISTFAVTFWISLFLTLKLLAYLSNKLFKLAQIPGKINLFINHPIQMALTLLITFITLVGLLSSITIEFN